MGLNFVSSLLLSWLVVWSTITTTTRETSSSASLMMSASAFEFTFHDEPEDLHLSITDEVTGIMNVKSLFIDEVHTVSVMGIEWMTNEAAATMNTTSGADVVLFWSTMVDGVMVASGNVSLTESDQLLPSELPAGSFVVTSNGKHTVEVIMTISDGTAETTVSNTYVAYRAGVSIIPMILVLVMAMTTQLVEVSLFSCVFVGACIVAGNLRDGFKNSLAVYLVEALYDEDHVFVVLFTLFLSGMVGMMEKSGGMIGFTKFVSKYAKTQRSGQYAVYITGCMIFFDDYANCLLAGETMKPLTDLLMVSREKLAFIVDATAAPVASISPVSSWVGFEIGLIVDEVDKLVEKYGEENLTITTSGLAIFLQSVKYRYYPLFMIFLMFCTIGFKRDYGPMLVAERKVTIFQRTDGGDGKGKQQSTGEQKPNQPDPNTPLYAFNMLIPVVVLVIFIFFLLVKTGEDDDPATNQSFLDKIEIGNSFKALLWGTFAASIITLILYLVQWYKPDGTLALPNYKTFCKFFCMKDNTHARLFDDDDDDDTSSNDAKPLLSLPIAVDSFIYGMGRIFPALIVLNLAWAVGSIMVDVGADRLFSRWIVGGLNPEILPTLSFLISFLMALATGTSWGTMTILFPLLLVPTYEASNGNEIIFYSTVAGVLSGSVAGDHVSPISDTTVLSALACDCQLLRHVTTQTPYVMVVVIISTLVGTLPIGSEAWPNIIGILVGCLIVVLFSYFICVPVASPIGRYDIVTEIGLRFFPNPELLELRENTKKFYSGEVLHVKEIENEKDDDDNDDENGETKKLSDDMVVPEEADRFNHASEDLA